jgi:hypothetical protein
MNIISGNASNQETAGRSGAIESVVAAMQAHLNNADVQNYGLKTLASLSLRSELRSRINGLWGVSVADAALSAHPGHGGVAAAVARYKKAIT